MKKIQELIEEAKQKNITTVGEFLKFIEPLAEPYKDSIESEFGRVLAVAYVKGIKNEIR